MTAATYKIERNAIDTDYMAALAVIDTEYQSQRFPVEVEYRAGYELLEQPLEFGDPNPHTQFDILTVAYNAQIAPLASAYMVKIKIVNRAYFASVHALGERYSKD